MTTTRKTKRNSPGSISDAAWRLLGVRARSRRELGQRLQRKGFSAGDVERELDRLQGLGYLDDAAFARNWAAGRQSSSTPRGSRAIAAELRVKGIEPENVQSVLAEMDDSVGARTAAERQALRLTGLAPIEFRRRLYAFLLRRGFNHEDARAAVEEAISRQGEEDEFT
jgi:regulatory protein